MNPEFTYGVPPADALKSMSGLDFLEAIAAGSLPQPPIGETLAFYLAEVSHGRVVFIGTPSEAVYNPLGSVHGGWYGTLLDSCMACAVQSTLEAGAGYTTVEYSVNLVRPITTATGAIRAEGTTIHRGRRMATADGRLTDAAGRLLAHGTTTCMIILPNATPSAS